MSVRDNYGVTVRDLRMTIHLIKLVVGVSDLEELYRINEHFTFDYEGQDAVRVRTRHFPRQQDDVLNGGSLYRVIKNRIVARQKVLGFEEGTDPDGRKCCYFICEARMMMTVSTPKRPFQGWRYLKLADAPADRAWFDPDGNEEPPEEMAAELKELGLI